MFPCQGSYLPQTLSGLFPQVLAWVLQSCSTLLLITDTSSPWTSSPDNIPGQPVFPLPVGPFLTGSQPKHVPCFVLSPSCHCLSLRSALPSHLSPDPSVPLAEARALCSSPAQRPYPPSVYLRIVKSTLFSHPCHSLLLVVPASSPNIFWGSFPLLLRDQETKFHGWVWQPDPSVTHP